MKPSPPKPSWEYLYEMRRKKEQRLKFESVLYDRQESKGYVYRTIHKLKEEIRRMWQ